MKNLAISVFALSVAATAASAADERMSDSKFIQANRCAGLAKTLTNVVDGEQLTALVKAQRGMRADYIHGKAADAMDHARRDAKKESNREALTAELSGPCASLLGGEAAVAQR